MLKELVIIMLVSIALKIRKYFFYSLPIIPIEYLILNSIKYSLCISLTLLISFVICLISTLIVNNRK